MIKNPFSMLLAMSVMACGSDGHPPADLATDASADTSPASGDASVASGDASDTSDASDPSDAPVDTRIASVSLASDCPDVAARGASLDEQCLAAEMCPSLCDQSSMQIRFVSDLNQAEAPRKVSVVAVRLLDAVSGKVLGALASREPAIWTMNDYSAWDERLTSGTVQAYYKLSAPDWAGIGAEWDASFILEVDLEIDGTTNTVRSDAVQRAPQVVT